MYSKEQQKHLFISDMIELIYHEVAKLPWYFGICYIISDEIELHFCAKIAKNFRFKENYQNVSEKKVVSMENT